VLLGFRDVLKSPREDTLLTYASPPLDNRGRTYVSSVRQLLWHSLPIVGRIVVLAAFKDFAHARLWALASMEGPTVDFEELEGLAVEFKHLRLPLSALT
jgi:hypothetical protein